LKKDEEDIIGKQKQLKKAKQDYTSLQKQLKTQLKGLQVSGTAPGVTLRKIGLGCAFAKILTLSSSKTAKNIPVGATHA